MSDLDVSRRAGADRVWVLQLPSGVGRVRASSGGSAVGWAGVVDGGGVVSRIGVTAVNNFRNVTRSEIMGEAVQALQQGTRHEC